MDESGLESSLENDIYHEQVDEAITLINEMVGDTKSKNDKDDMSELMTNSMDLGTEVVIEEQETFMHKSFPMEEEPILHEKVVDLFDPISSPPIKNSIRLDQIDFIGADNFTLTMNPYLVDLANCMKTTFCGLHTW